MILCHTKGQGNGGFIDINAETLNLRGKSILSAASFASGNGGFIGLNLTTCNITSGSQINSSTFGLGKSGTIELKAEGWVNIQGDKSGLISISGPNSSGDAGYILVETGNLTMSETAKINTSSEGIGNAGNIDLITEKIDLESGAKVSSVSSGTGKAGGIIIKASDRISLDQSTVSVQSKDADGGDIDIYTTYWLKLQNSKISAEVKGGTGNGGNIYIDPIYVILENSSIIANAFGGSGGNITIVTNLYLKNIASIVSASSKLGIDGSVEIFAPDIDVSSSLQALPVNFEEVEKMLPERCSARTRGDSGSFQITGRYALPSDPDAVIFFP
ncbi:S-layer family protein [bacterium]|nr:S-layer family protein [bacterium]